MSFESLLKVLGNDIPINFVRWLIVVPDFVWKTNKIEKKHTPIQSFYRFQWLEHFLKPFGQRQEGHQITNKSLEINFFDQHCLDYLDQH